MIIPEMVVVPAGEFLMGSSENEDGRSEHEGPQHRVVISKPFGIGKYQVTFDEYGAFCDATGRKKPYDQGWGQGRRPVINVSWYDAIAYCEWLSEQTGECYRLPTEAEWEYACRAGITSRYCYGDDEQRLGEYAWYSSNARRKTHPVGKKKPNAWQLYDMHGNVWEWVQDSWHYNYEGAPVDGSGWVEKGGSSGVLRGGSWLVVPLRMRGAARLRFNPHGWNLSWGFRLARTLP